MKRVIYNKLLKWKNSKNRKPLILEGARQVGKTWIIKEFGKNEYRNFAYINCDNNPLLDNLFIDYDVDRIIRQLDVITNINITPNDTLIFFDEVQELKDGLSFLKYFYENKPEYHIIVAGSLLGLMMNKGTGFPVGKTDSIKLCPLSFEEFLMALGKDELFKKDVNYKELSSLKSMFIDLLRQYFYVGGMPEAVSSYINDKDLNKVRDIQNNILKGYKRDFTKHVDPSLSKKISMVWDSIPRHLGKENKKFVYGAIRKGARAKEFEESLVWLEDAGLINKVNCINKFDKPIKYYENENIFKVFLLDIGLLAAMSNISSKDIFLFDTIFSEYKGEFSEQFFAQQYFSLQNNLYYFTNANSTRENDFVFENDKVYIVEIKASENTKSKSLSTSLKENINTYGLRFSLKDYIVQDRLSNIPLYLCNFFLNELFEDN